VPAPPQNIGPIWNQPFGHLGTISDFWPIFKIFYFEVLLSLKSVKIRPKCCFTNFQLMPAPPKNIGPIWNRPFGHSGMISDLRPILENLISWFFWVYKCRNMSGLLFSPIFNSCRHLLKTSAQFGIGLSATRAQSRTSGLFFKNFSLGFF
jgi:hypothetical protein